MFYQVPFAFNNSIGHGETYRLGAHVDGQEHQHHHRHHLEVLRRDPLRVVPQEADHYQQTRNRRLSMFQSGHKYDIYQSY